jgi:hypothetical protein
MPLKIKITQTFFILMTLKTIHKKKTYLFIVIDYSVSFEYTWHIKK